MRLGSKLHFRRRGCAARACQGFRRRQHWTLWQSIKFTTLKPMKFGKLLARCSADMDGMDILRYKELKKQLKAIKKPEKAHANQGT